MLSMHVDTFIAHLVEQFLIGTREALHFHLDLRMEYYGLLPTDGRTYRVHRDLHLLYCRPIGYGSISVFSGMAKKFQDYKAIKEWNHEITGDSCWTNIPIFSQQYFSMAAEINRRLVDHKHQEVCPDKMKQTTFFSDYKKAFDWVPVEVKTDPKDENKYRKLITVL